jgi:hypothetical protein
MNTSINILLLTTLFISSCSDDSFEAADCSISMNGVLFSKSINQGDILSGQQNKNKVEINSGAKTDFFNEPDGKHKYANAPMLLTLLNNKEPFTFTARVCPEFAETYDAGAVYVFVNEDKWLKFAFEMDEKKRTRMVTVRTNGTSDDNNHDVVAEKQAYLKISSDTESIGYYYSIDSVDWQLVRVFKNDFPASAYIGISSQSPLGKGIKTTFENISLRNESIKDFRKGI